MQESHQLEEEVKLEAGPAWFLPDLAGVVPGAQVRSLPALSLVTTYYDTLDLRLTRRRVALRHRLEQPAALGDVAPVAPPVSGTGSGAPPVSGDMQPAGSGAGAGTPPLDEATGRAGAQGGPAGVQTGPAGAWALKLGRLHAVFSDPAPVRAQAPAGTSVWTVKLPPEADGSVLARTEVNWQGEPEPAPYPPAVAFLSAVTLGAPLQPIARLSAARRRTELLVAGRPAAEVDEDSVEGTVLAGQGGGTVAFKEIEVELAPGGPREVLEAVAAKLIASGARPSARTSKLWTVLQSAPHSGLPVEEVSALPAKTPPGGRAATMADVLQEQARCCLEVLVEHDPPVRLGDPDPEHVHRARVATRRFRSLLWALRRLQAPEPGDGSEPLTGDGAGPWIASLRRELRWLGGALGAARDADVRLIALESDCAGLDQLDQGAAARILDAARAEQATAHEKLLGAMSDGRYLELLRCLDAVGKGRQSGDGDAVGYAAPPPSTGLPADEVPAGLWQRFDMSAGPAMARLGAAQWRSVRRAVRRLDGSPSDEGLHQLRIQAKRLRYIAEAAAPVVHPSSSKRAALATATAATDLQDVLGQLHDAVENERWLRDLAAAAMAWASNGASASPAGVALVAGQLLAARRATAARSRRAWKRQWQRLDHRSLAKWA